MKFSSKILAINKVFSKYKVFVFSSRLHKYPTVMPHPKTDRIYNNIWFSFTKNPTSYSIELKFLKDQKNPRKILANRK